MRKKLLSIVMIIVILNGLVPNIFLTTASAAYTCEQITAKVENYLSIVGSNRYWNANIRSTETLKSQLEAGDYLSCTTTGKCNIPSNKSHIRDNGCTSNSFTGVSGGIAQCWGFGDYIEYMIFGTTTRNFGSSSNRKYSVDQNFEFLPGDLIWSTKGSSSQHIRVVYKTVGDTVYCIEGNYDGRCRIGVKTYTKSDMRSYVNYSSSSYVLIPPVSYRTSTPIYIEPPTNCAIQLNKTAESTYANTETVKLMFHAENVSSYYIEIYKDGNLYESLNTIYGEYSRTYSEVGHYSAVAYAINDGGKTASGWIGWNIADSTSLVPINLYLSTDKSVVSSNETITINHWAEKVSYYNMKIYRYGKLIHDSNEYTGQSIVSFEASGKYDVIVTAINDYGSISRQTSFSVQGNDSKSPNNFAAWINKLTFAADENITIYHWAENVSFYQVKIYRYGKLLYEKNEETSQTSVSYNASGDYIVEITAVNDYGISTQKLNFNIISDNSQAPQNFSLWTSNQNFKPGDSILISHWAENVSYYQIKVFKGTELKYENYEMTSQTTLSYTEPGIYCVEATAINDSGITTSKIYFGVGTYSVCYNKNFGNENIKQDCVDYCSLYVLQENIFKKEGYKLLEWNTKADGSGLSYKPGDIYSEKKDVMLFAQWKKLEPCTHSTVNNIQNNYTINIEFTDVLKGKVVIAGYKDNRFVTLQIKEYSEDFKPITLTGDIDTVKVMVWDNIFTIKPITAVEEIPNSEWIVQ